MAEGALCKFWCSGVEAHVGGSKTVRLRTHYDPALPKDVRFHEATPSGDISFLLKNEALEGFFEPGRYYLVTITPTEG